MTTFEELKRRGQEDGGSLMIFKGIKVTFSTENGRQYIDIAKFWDIMEKHYDVDRLSGLGLNWTKNTMDYIIGFRDNSMTNEVLKVIKPYYTSAEYVIKLLPNRDWEKYKGHVSKIKEKYSEIWKAGAVKFEIETFDKDGNMKLLIHR